MFLLMSLGLAVATRGRALHRVSHAHAALFVAVGEKARPYDRRAWRGCRLRRAGARAGGRDDLKAGDTGSLNFARSRVRATMSCERAHAMIPHARIVVCAVCSASAREVI